MNPLQSPSLKNSPLQCSFKKLFFRPGGAWFYGMRDPDGKRYCGKVVFGETTETNHTRYQTKELRDQIIEMGEEANTAQIFERLDKCLASLA